MGYVVEIRREREPLTEFMTAIRQWLDGRRFEPDAFRCTIEEEGITCRIEFKIESEALACADAFGGQLRSRGDKSAGCGVRS